MSTSFGIGLILYVLPVFVLVWLAFAKRLCWTLAVSLLLLAPAIGDFCYVFYLKWLVSAFRSNAVLSFAIGLYPFALIPLGFWASAIGSLAWIGIRYFDLRSRVAPSILAFGGVVSGSTAGVVFFLLYYVVVSRLAGEQRFDYNPLYPLVLAGAGAGAISGLLVVLLSGDSRPHSLVCEAKVR